MRWSTHPASTTSPSCGPTQDWYLRYHLQAVPGVAEVAPLGGFVRQYQVNVDPNRLQAYNIPIIEGRGGGARRQQRCRRAAAWSSAAPSTWCAAAATPSRADDIGNIVLARERQAACRCACRTSATWCWGPTSARGVADWNGDRRSGGRHRGDAAGRERAARDRARESRSCTRLEPGLPKGVKIVTTYDRSDLILRSIDNLKHTLIEELIIVALVILIFLWHVPSAMIPIFTIPVAIIISFIPMKMMGLTSNIMSLGGIAIAIGAMVDAAIVVVEQTHKKLEEWERGGRKEDYHRVVIDAVKEVGGPSFFALLVIAVSFLPVLTLEAQEGRLFKPLAYTKNLSMIVAAVLAITLDPAHAAAVHPHAELRVPAALAGARRQRGAGGQDSFRGAAIPISRVLIRLYEPVCAWSLRWKWLVIGGGGGAGGDHGSGLRAARLGVHAAAR